MQLIIRVWVTLLLVTTMPVKGEVLPLPEPEYRVKVERSVMITMPDGARLSSDLYFPVGVSGRLPTILIRLPYGKNRWYRPGRYRGAYLFAEQGYAVVVQDMRGTFESVGDFQLGGDQGDDTYDMLDWITAQPWSNGKVGTYGCSYMASVQQELAVRNHPAHAAMIPQAAFGSRDGGAVGLVSLFGWARSRGSEVYLQAPANAPQDFWQRYGDYYNPAPVVPPIDSVDLLNSLPIVDLMKKAGAPPNSYERIVRGTPFHLPVDETAQQQRDAAMARVPGIHMNSWYDAGVAQTLEQFSRLRNQPGGERQYAIIAPGTHCQGFFLGIREFTDNTVVGERNLGDARYDFWQLYLRWFDRYLRGISNGVEQMDPLQIYVMGANTWRGEQQWPLSGTRFTPYYLHSNGRANGRFGDGILSTERPVEEKSDSFFYDPQTPVSTHGGQVCGDCLPLRSSAEGNYALAIPDGAMDQSDIEMRHDVLVYSSDVLEDGIEVTGPIELTLYVSSSAVDTDFTAKLIDVYPDGTVFNLQESILRARYREGFDKARFMQPDKVYKLTLNLEATSNWFAPGHRIRLEVSSSNFPRFDRNLNTGGNNYDETASVVAKNSIYHSKRYPSHVVLPIIPNNRTSP